MLDELKVYAHNLDVDNKVTFWGTRDDILELVALCYMGIQLFYWEGVGLTAVELMAVRKPVIASDVPRLNQVVHGAGLLFERGNDKQLAELIKCLAEDRNEYGRVANLCKIRTQRYDINNMVEEYMKVYKALLRWGKSLICYFSWINSVAWNREDV